MYFQLSGYPASKYPGAHCCNSCASTVPITSTGIHRSVPANNARKSYCVQLHQVAAAGYSCLCMTMRSGWNVCRRSGRWCGVWPSSMLLFKKGVSTASWGGMYRMTSTRQISESVWLSSPPISLRYCTCSLQSYVGSGHHWVLLLLHALHWLAEKRRLHLLVSTC